MDKNKQFDEHLNLTDTIHMSGYGLLWEDCTDIAYQIQEQGYRKASDVAREIFEELETVFCLLSHPVIRGDGTITSVNADGLHLRLEDYLTIKKKYESENKE